MSFVLTFDETEFSAQAFRSGNNWAVVVNIGYDDATNSMYSLNVGFSQAAGGETEFYFYIIEVDAETDGEYLYWEGANTRSFLKGNDRAMVLRAVVMASQVLTMNAGPDEFFMITYEPNLPDKALVKHQTLGRMFEYCGYTVKCADPYHGKRAWKITKNNNKN